MLKWAGAIQVFQYFHLTFLQIFTNSWTRLFNKSANLTLTTKRRLCEQKEERCTTQKYCRKNKTIIKRPTIVTLHPFRITRKLLRSSPLYNCSEHMEILCSHPITSTTPSSCRFNQTYQSGGIPFIYFLKSLPSFIPTEKDQKVVH